MPLTLTPSEFRAQVQEQIKVGMRNKDSILLETYRSISSQISMFEKANPGKEWSVIDIVQPLAKKRQQAIESYKSVGVNASEQMAQEMSELSILEEFLPVLMSRDEIYVKLKNIASLNAYSLKSDMGKLLSSFKEMCPGQDLKIASEIAREILS